MSYYASFACVAPGAEFLGANNCNVFRCDLYLLSTCQEFHESSDYHSVSLVTGKFSAGMSLHCTLVQGSVHSVAFLCVWVTQTWQEEWQEQDPLGCRHQNRCSQALLGLETDVLGARQADTQTPLLGSMHFHMFPAHAQPTPRLSANTRQFRYVCSIQHATAAR